MKIQFIQNQDEKKESLIRDIKKLPVYIVSIQSKLPLKSTSCFVQRPATSDGRSFFILTSYIFAAFLLNKKLQNFWLQTHEAPSS